jgi:carbonic anhydrase
LPPARGTPAGRPAPVPAGQQTSGQDPAAHDPSGQPAPTAAPATAAGKDGLLPIHRPNLFLPPRAALAHLRAGNAAYVLAARDGKSAPRPAPRPSGAGRYVAAVVVCADATLDVPFLFGLAPEEVLLLSTPAANLTVEDTAVLERAAAQERLSLCVVLTHADCPSLAGGQAQTKAQEVLERSTARARELAARRGIPVAKAQALEQCEDLLAASAPLRALAKAGRFQVVPATVEPRTGAIHWHTTQAEELPLPPVK